MVSIVYFDIPTPNFIARGDSDWFNSASFSDWGNDWSENGYNDWYRN